MKKYTKKIVSILTALVMVLGLTLVGNTSAMMEVKAAPLGTFVNAADYPNGIDEADLVEGNYYQVGIKVLNSWGLMFNSTVDSTDSIETEFVNGGYPSLTLLETYESGKEVDGVEYVTDSASTVTITTPSGYWRYMDTNGNGDYKFIPTGSLSVDGDVKCYGMVGEQMLVEVDATKDTKVFDEWSGTDGLTFTYGNENMNKIQFKMPNRNVEIVSSYKDNDGSGSGGQHQHMYLGYKSDTTGHWRLCDCGDPNSKTPLEQHTDTNNNNKCDICDWDMTPVQSGGQDTGSTSGNQGGQDTSSGGQDESVKQPETNTKSDVPKTGDSITEGIMWTVLGLLSIGAIVGVMMKKKIIK